MSSFIQNSAQFVDKLKNMAGKIIYRKYNFSQEETFLHVDEMTSDNAVFSTEVAERKSKTCGKENMDYRSGK
jgi:hypothetical protein